MRPISRVVSGWMLAAIATVLLPACYESVDQQPPQAQSPQAPPQAGPVSGQMSQGGGSALAGAKRSATNVVNQAEQASQRVANEAGEPGEQKQPPAKPDDDG